jgi:enoyl-CoA hydratase/carnithine racemase
MGSTKEGLDEAPGESDMSTSTSNVLLEAREGGVVTLTLHRPEFANRLNRELIEALHARLSGIRWDRSVRVVIITGSGSTFSEGVFTPTERGALELSERIMWVRLHHGLTELIEALEKPVIAAINGHARAGGLELTLACDYRIASDTARFDLPEIPWGVFPGAGAPVRLPRLIGKARAKEMMFTGRMIEAQEALEIGLVERVIPAAELQQAALSLAQQMEPNGPIGMAYVKQIVNRGMETDIATAMALNSALRWSIESTWDIKEGIAAYNEGRKPQYRGE